MTPVKRIEIIASEKELRRILKTLDQVGIPGYTVIKPVTGKSPHGQVSEDMEFTDLGANAYVLVFCEAALVEPTLTALKPTLDYFGGICFVSDAQRI